MQETIGSWPRASGNQLLSGHTVLMKHYKWLLLPIMVGVLGACGPVDTGDTPPTSTSADAGSMPPAQTPVNGSAAEEVRTVLDRIPVKGKAPKTGYTREQFGDGWLDTDSNGCDTRNDILARDLTEETMKDACVVYSGLLQDPYTGTAMQFYRDGAPGAPDTDNDGTPGFSSAVQIDHIVALSNGWQTGAQQLSREDREAFANDPLNLLAVDGATNMAKSDASADAWLPPNRSYWCTYTVRQTLVKDKYHLWMTDSEKARISEVVNTCSEEVLSEAPNTAETGVNGWAGTATPDVEPETILPLVEPEPSMPAAPSVNADNGVDPDYRSCKEVKKQGLGPYVRGVDPEYGFYNDGDSDGKVCE